MRELKCDLCKEKIEKEPVTIGIGFFPNTDLCHKCGDFVIKFLKENKFIDSENKKIRKL